MQVKFFPTLPSNYFSSVCGIPCPRNNYIQKTLVFSKFTLIENWEAAVSRHISEKVSSPFLTTASHQLLNFLWPKDHISIIRFSSRGLKKQVRTCHFCFNLQKLTTPRRALFLMVFSKVWLCFSIYTLLVLFNKYEWTVLEVSCWRK